MGNLNCGCSDIEKENSFSCNNEDEVEFQPEVFSHPTTNPVLVIKNLPNYYSRDSIEGELFKYQKTKKEILIPRWCTLCEGWFKYYKSHYSYLSKDSPLFEISTDRISYPKFYIDKEKHFMELYFDMTGNKLHSSSSLSSISSRPSLRVSRHRNTPSNFSTNEEWMIFFIKTKNEWENWKSCFQ